MNAKTKTTRMKFIEMGFVRAPIGGDAEESNNNDDDNAERKKNANEREKGAHAI